MTLEHRVGQVWADRRNKPKSVYVILRLYTRTYKNGDTATRVKGVVVCGENNWGVRDLDARSAALMFPALKFDPHHQEEETPQ